MRHPIRLSTLFLIGVLTIGSTALGYYYYFVYEPPLGAAEAFMSAMESRNAEALKNLVVVTPERNSTELRPPKQEEIERLLLDPFQRGRVLDQDTRSGASGNYSYLVYRQPDGTIYALMVTLSDRDYKIVIPERPGGSPFPYLWDYRWTN